MWIMILFMMFSISSHAADLQPRSLRMIIPFAAGGAFDVFGRQFGDFVEKETARNVVVENIPGNNSILGSRRHLRSGANNLMLTSYAFYTAVESGELDARDFVPVAVMGHAPLFLVVNRNRRLTCEQLRNPKTTWLLAHSGLEQTTGIPVRLIRELYPNVTDVPYRGTPQISVALLSNEIDATFVSGATMIRPEYDVLANTSRSRVNDIITLRECLGIRRVVENQWLLFASPGSSPEFVQQINSLATRFATSPDYKNIFDRQGIMPLNASVRDTVNLINRELQTSDQ